MSESADTEPTGAGAGSFYGTVAPAHDLGDPDPPRAPLAPISKARLTLIVAPIVAFWLMNVVQWLTQASLADTNPMLLMALGPSNRNVVFAAHKVQAGEAAFVAYLVIGTLRLLGPDASFFALGRRYNDRAIVWMEGRTASMGSSLRSLERLFAKAGHALVVIMPNNPVCLLVGASGMSVPVFATLNVIGTIGRMFVLYWVGDVLSGAIDWFFVILREYRPWFIAASVLSAAVLYLTEFRKGTTELQAVAHLDEALEGSVDEELFFDDTPPVPGATETATTGADTAGGGAVGRATEQDDR